MWGESDAGWQCAQGKTFAEAEAICQAAGARLCTTAELVNGCTAGTGCMFDFELVWGVSSPPPPSTTGLGVTTTPTERVHFTLALIGSGLATVALLALLFFARKRSKKASVKAAVGKKSPSLPSVKVGPSIDDQAIQLASAVEAPSDVLAGEGVLLVSTARQRAGLSWFKPTQVKLLTGPHEPAHDGESPLWSALVMDSVTVSYDEMAGVRMDVSALEFIVERKYHSAPHAQGGPPPHYRYLHIRMYNRSEFNLWREALSPKITNPHLTPMACEPKNKSSAVHAAQKWLSSAEGAAAGTS